MKTGTIHEKLKEIERITGLSTGLHHEIYCRRGSLSCEFHFFIGRQLVLSSDNWSDVHNKFDDIINGVGYAFL